MGITSKIKVGAERVLVAFCMQSFCFEIGEPEALPRGTVTDVESEWIVAYTPGELLWEAQPFLEKQYWQNEDDISESLK